LFQDAFAGLVADDQAENVAALEVADDPLGNVCIGGLPDDNRHARHTPIYHQQTQRAQDVIGDEANALRFLAFLQCLEQFHTQGRRQAAVDGPVQAFDVEGGILTGRNVFESLHQCGQVAGRRRFDSQQGERQRERK
jgi:hypothetical protein